MLVLLNFLTYLLIADLKLTGFLLVELSLPRRKSFLWKYSEHSSDPVRGGGHFHSKVIGMLVVFFRV